MKDLPAGRPVKSKRHARKKNFYEVERTLNGHGRDLLLDSAGVLVGWIAFRLPLRRTKVEMITNGQTVTYEAAVTKARKVKSSLPRTAQWVIVWTAVRIERRRGVYCRC